MMVIFLWMLAGVFIGGIMMLLTFKSLLHALIVDNAEKTLYEVIDDKIYIVRINEKDVDKSE